MLNILLLNALKLHLKLLNFQNQKKFSKKIKLRGISPRVIQGVFPSPPLSSGNPELCDGENGA
jgi:hypothetical protein